MNIAIVINHFDPHGGTYERSAARIADDLAGRGHAVTLLTAVRDPYRNVRDYDVSAMVSAPRISALTLGRFAGWVRKRLADDFDVGLSLTTAAPAQVIEPLDGTVHESHARGPSPRLTDVVRPRRNVWLRRERQTLSDPMVRSFVVVSQYMQQQLIDPYNIDPARIETLVHPVAAAAMVDESNDARQRIRHAFDISDDAPAFVFTADQPRRNGLSSLLRAAKLMMDRDIRFALLLAGPVGYGAQQEAADLGIRGRVRFIGPTSRMADLFRAADVLVHPSLFEPAGTQAVEAILYGVPVITTRYNGAADLVAEPDAAPRGRIIDEPTDIIALADAMIQLTDTRQRQACRDACAGLADRISTARHVDRLEQILVAAASQS